MIFADVTYQDCLMTFLTVVLGPLVVYLLNKSRLKDNVRDAKIDEIKTDGVVNNQMTAAVAVKTGAAKMIEPETIESALAAPKVVADAKALEGNG